VTILSQVTAEGVGDGDELGFGEAFGGELHKGLSRDKPARPIVNGQLCLDQSLPGRIFTAKDRAAQITQDRVGHSRSSSPAASRYRLTIVLPILSAGLVAPVP